MVDSARALLEQYPKLYLSLLKLKRTNHWSRSWVVTKQHDLVVEGFPRSANSFAFHALSSANDGKLSIATHTHSPAQIQQAVKWSIPTMVLLREPKDAVIGLLAFNRELDNCYDSKLDKVTKKEVLSALNRWVYFYNRIQEVRDKVFIARFDKVIDDFEGLSKRFVHWSGRNWNHYNSKIIPESVILGEAFHIGPNKRRHAIKQDVRKQLEKLQLNTEYSSAHELYTAFGYD